MGALHVKKGDMVVVLSGEDKGKVGKVLFAQPEKRRVMVEGVNVVHKAVRKSQDNPKGGIMTKEAPIAASKVMLQERHEIRQKRRTSAAVARA